MQEASEEVAAGKAAENADTELGATAPIMGLSMLAVQEAILEMGVQARQSTVNTQEAIQRIWHSAEKQLGIEVEFEDPALRELFRGCLCVETILGQIRQQAEALQSASWQLHSAPYNPLTEGIASLCGEESPMLQSFVKLNADAEAMHNHLIQRLRHEVFDRIDRQVQAHQAVRDDVRDRNRWQTTLAHHRNELTKMRQRRFGSGLRNLDGKDRSKRIEELEQKLAMSMRKVQELDQSVFGKLLELKRTEAEAVRWPWAALLQIRSEFYAGQAKHWSPVADSMLTMLTSLPQAGGVDTPSVH